MPSGRLFPVFFNSQSHFLFILNQRLHFYSCLDLFLLPFSSLWWKYYINEWHNLLTRTPSRVPTLPGLYVDCQSTSWLWHLHQLLCHKYRANLRLHHCVVRPDFFCQLVFNLQPEHVCGLDSKQATVCVTSVQDLC